MDNTLANRIQTILKEQHLKQIELAKALGVSANYISILVMGRKTQVSLTLAKLIESLYGYSAEWVMTGKGVKNIADLLRQQAVERIMEMDNTSLMKLKEFLK